MMMCPNCEESFELEDDNEDEAFQCDRCAQWLKLDLDEGTYEGAVKRTLIMLDEFDAPS